MSSQAASLVLALTMLAALAGCGEEVPPAPSTADATHALGKGNTAPPASAKPKHKAGEGRPADLLSEF